MTITNAQCPVPSADALNSVLPYFGGKRTMAPVIVADHLGGARDFAGVTLYVEPFHGSAAVLLGMREAGYRGPATVNDLDQLNYNLMCVLSNKDAAFELWQWMQPIGLHETAYKAALEFLDKYAGDFQYDRDTWLRVNLAGSYLIASWMGRNGEAGLDKPWMDQLKGFCLRWTSSGGDPSVRWLRAVQSVPTWHKWLHEKTTFLCRDALDVLADVPDSRGTVIYCDPPYLHATRGSARYRVDSSDNTGTMFEAGDFHDRLACSLERFKESRVVVSYYAHERLQRLYPTARVGKTGGWTHIDMKMNKALTNAGGRGAGDSTAAEVLIVRQGIGH